MEKSESATTARHPIQQLCNGYNIEQRECNLFECKGRVNELLAEVAENSFSSPLLFPAQFRMTFTKLFIVLHLFCLVMMKNYAFSF
jgi:hypothetical protein